MQSRGDSLPAYTVVNVEGAPHQQHFTVDCQVKSLSVTVRGEGTSRRKAEQAAAAAVLENYFANE